MGKISNSINRYLSDNRRFADLFNGVCFHGKAVVHAEELLEASQVYHGITGTVETSGSSPGLRERTRDICKHLKSGETLRVLAVENQHMTDYTMPFRCMQYDVMEYEKQLDTLKEKNKRSGDLKAGAERICGIRKTDRIAPVYTICLYHGEEAWDGPRSLKDMMDFGNVNDDFREFFKDYPMHLYCLNEADDLQVFRTELGVLFQALQYRKDRAGLKALVQRDERYRHMDIDTLETMSVMLNLSSVWKERRNYMEKNEDNEEEYDMCQAIREWAEEERSIGREEGHRIGLMEGRQSGLMESRRVIVRNMLLRGMTDEDIMAIAECNQELIDAVRGHI